MWDLIYQFLIIAYLFTLLAYVLQNTSQALQKMYHGKRLTSG